MIAANYPFRIDASEFQGKWVLVTDRAASIHGSDYVIDGGTMPTI